ncbi:MAG: response regulator [Burkholderiales bacterium]|nr:response regulator [Burkholderiales bacterium]
MRVLYVDDDRVNSLLFAELCRMAPGVSVEAAGTAAEALELLERIEADLLVLDLHLPDGDGFSLLPRLWQKAGRRLPAYLCSADDPAQVEVQARAAGFEACWSKPLDVPLVLAALRRHAGPSGKE